MDPEGNGYNLIAKAYLHTKCCALLRQGAFLLF